MPSSRLVRVLVLLVAVLVALYPAAVDFLVDLAWFDAAGFQRAFEVRFTSQAALFAGGLVVAGGFAFAVLGAAIRQVPVHALQAVIGQAAGGVPLSPHQVRRILAWARLGLALLVGFLFGMFAAGRWMEVLALLHRQEFGIADPVFGHDLGFYAYLLPVLRDGRGALVAMVVLTTLPVAGLVLATESARSGGLPVDPTPGRRLLGGLVALLVLLGAAGRVLDRYTLLLDRDGAVFGAGYADVVARIPALWAMATLGVAAAVVVVLGSRRGRLAGPGLAVAGWFLAGFVLLRVVPGMVQSYVVRPNELSLERPYLEHEIRSTRQAYALDRIEVQPFEAAGDLDLAAIRDNPLTVGNIRLWDTRPLEATYAQLQEIRLYYQFRDVDVDRYTVDGAVRQVMLSARELETANLPAQARSWMNQHLQYTHGYGLTMSPVNVVTREGLPELWIQDLPPRSSVGLAVDRPEIYYGEATDDYVFVRTSAREFDYPSGDSNVYTTYEGRGGVPAGGFARKLLFSLYFRTFDVLLSDYIQPESRVMFRRSVPDRARAIAPFLVYDGDPYVVLDQGRLVWVVDAYTTSDHIPYAEPARMRGRVVNYVRNSVKVTVDAYDGTVRFYVADPTDPLIRTWQAVFPDMFRPLSEMPASLRAHLRYPLDFFDVQADKYRAYHMLDPTVFYNREDMWAVPEELYGGQPQPMRPYYLIMKLPDSDRAEFILLLPFTPTNRDNMISWLAARSDEPEYGKLILYQFPKQKMIYGPRQIEARIDQDPEISELITLWSQSGSRVVRGNLLVIPIAGSLLYVEPLYLQAESSQLPELKRVIVSYNNRLAMRPTLDEALAAVFGEAAPAAPRPGGGGEQPAPLLGDESWATLATAARQAFDAAVAAQRQGDWAAYGDRLRELGQALEALADLAGNDAEAAAPAATAPGEAPPDEAAREAETP